MDDNSRVIITLEPGFTKSGSEPCSTTDGAMTTSVARTAGEAIVRTATAALLSGNTLVLRGAGNCDDWSGIERAAYVVIRN
ncbi:MAG: hypothetical protein AAF654_10375 [Myxococcota bacterium]